MDSAFTLFPDQASTAATRVDGLMWFMVAVCGFITLLVAGMIGYFVVKYRRRTGNMRGAYILGSTKLETFWIITPLAIAMVMFGWGMNVYFFIVRPPENALQIYVVGKQWMWKVQHPGGQREINQVHVPLGRPVKLMLISQDVIHSFYVPAFRIKVDVLPNRYVQTWFEATKSGEYHLFCAEYCGTGHANMIGQIVVMKPEDYEAWLSGRAEGSLALDGRKLFLQYQCVVCHSADALARGPVLEGLFGTAVPLQDGRRVLANEQYIRESILEPDAKIVAGFGPIMPSYQGQINEDEMIQLIAFIRSLQPGGTPDRVDRASPPEAKPKPSKPEDKQAS